MHGLSYSVPGQGTQWLEASVRAVDPACDDVVAIELEYPVPLQAHEAGSHIKVQVIADGRQATRSYSVVEHRGRQRLLIAVRRLDNGQGGSKFMHALRVGDRLRASLPGNHFVLLPGAPSYMLIAGGIGVTPIVGMARALRALRARFKFFYLGRKPEAMPFLPRLLAEFGEDLVVHIDAQAGPFDLQPHLAMQPGAAEAYVCGPVPMLEALQASWAAAGRPRELLRFETFGAASDRPSEAFRVSVNRRNIEFLVPPERNLLEMLEERGCEPLYFCQRGECGLCAVDVVSLEGDLDHRDVFLSADQRAQGRQLCACVSRATGSITIDMP